MRIFYDTEFLEDGETIELISIGMVAEDGREMYLCNRDFRWTRLAGRSWRGGWTIHEPWLVDNVVPHLPRLSGDARLHYATSGPLGMLDLRNMQGAYYQPRATIAARVKEFVQATPDVELWADYGAYDHVVLCQLYGKMIDLPDGFPMWTHDFQQAWENAGKPELPEQTSGLHSAIADARHLRGCFVVLAGVSSSTEGEPS
jgi:hypothetical protein